MAGAQVTGCDPSPLSLAPFADACGLPFVSQLHDPDALRDALQQAQTWPRRIELRAL